ncbi:hypothetical protein QVD17_36089 [Tagetes erecta]|uniref:Uncharacterized protein n=1 Tax=Tagetes erecta TaxID=13708 RepID=A0AAD8NIT3_TARER|nr:hypothetical protein QVD17_36089 [Tagetes erecta]
MKIDSRKLEFPKVLEYQDKENMEIAKDVGWVFDNIDSNKVNDDGMRVYQIVQHMENANNLIFKFWLMDKDEHKFDQVGFYLSFICESPLNSNLEARNGYLRLHVEILVMLAVGKRRSDVPFDPGGFDMKIKLEDDFFFKNGEYDAGDQSYI